MARAITESWQPIATELGTDRSGPNLRDRQGYPEVCVRGWWPYRAILAVRRDSLLAEAAAAVGAAEACDSRLARL